MASLHLSSWISFALFAICLSNLRGSFTIANEERKDYIVYMGALPSSPKYSAKAHHMSILQEVVSRSYAEKSLIRSYTRSFNGFAAHLTQEEANKLSANEEVVSIFPSQTLQLHTTKSWDFMKFTQTTHRNPSAEGDVIVGLLDTGIWPESESFSDHGFGPIPKKWKGVCEGGENFTCNKKIIGARFYSLESSRDVIGHGSHTASIAAGNNVKNASFYGIAQGIARGGAPSARIATYKVCASVGCSETTILAAFDDAIADGVDVLSVSLGRRNPISVKEDVVAIGSLHAAEKGILTVQSAGNSGPGYGIISSVAPWLFSVAASTIDRKIVTKVELGNGKAIMGYSVNSFELKENKIPVVYGDDATRHCSTHSAKNCNYGCLDEKTVKGKIVICKTMNVYEVGLVGALGLISFGGGASSANVSDVFPLATSVLNSEQFELAESYYNSTKNPTMNILKSNDENDMDAPVVAGFSSRGPNEIIPDILKPDITAPGVDILAAFSPKSPPSNYNMDKRSVSYNILSGTSMSCPHVAGAAAYVKSLHPDWSPSAIKSALMTTASRMKTATDYGENEFSYGAGHLDPVKAANPGILYVTPKEDYIKLLCSMNITSSIATKISGYNITCNGADRIEPKNLNYPSMAAQIENDGDFKVQFSRQVTNIGLPNSTYNATITTSSQCDVTVVPNVLSFKELNEEKSFVVTVVGKLENVVSASLEWFDGIHCARSPIVVYK